MRATAQVQAAARQRILEVDDLQEAAMLAKARSWILLMPTIARRLRS
jgi:hypothetical protein